MGVHINEALLFHLAFIQIHCAIVRHLIQWSYHSCHKVLNNELRQIEQHSLNCRGHLYSVCVAHD